MIWYTLACATCTEPPTFKFTRRWPCEYECVLNGALMRLSSTTESMADGVLTVTVNGVLYVICKGDTLIVGLMVLTAALRYGGEKASSLNSVG